jgi:hypothetical protein
LKPLPETSAASVAFEFKTSLSSCEPDREVISFSMILQNLLDPPECFHPIFHFKKNFACLNEDDMMETS